MPINSIRRPASRFPPYRQTAPHRLISRLRKQPATRLSIPQRNVHQARSRPAEATASGRTPTPRRRRVTRRADVDGAVVESSVLARDGELGAGRRRHPTGPRPRVISGGRCYRGVAGARAGARCWFWGGAATAGARPAALGARPLADAPPAAGGRCRLPARSPSLCCYAIRAKLSRAGAAAERAYSCAMREASRGESERALGGPSDA